MESTITKKQNQIIKTLKNLTLDDTPKPQDNIIKSNDQNLVEELTQITDTMIDDINKLIHFLKKGRSHQDFKYFCITHDQKSEQWHEERKIRLTGSNFKTYIHALPNTRIKAPYEAFHKESKEVHSKAIDYGVNNQHIARDEYAKLNPQWKIKETTLTIRTTEPWIGASPDSLVFDLEDKLVGAIQIKCPFSKKDMTVEQAIKMPDFYLKENGQKQVQLQQKHAYYYQVQGQMMVLDLGWVDFVVRTQKNMKVVRVVRNQGFIQYLRRELQRYYFQNYIWEVLKQYARSDYLKQRTKYWMSKQKAAELVGKLHKV